MQQFVFLTVVANRPCGGVGVKGEIVIRRALNRNESEWFGVPQDGISDTAQNETLEFSRQQGIMNRRWGVM